MASLNQVRLALPRFCFFLLLAFIPVRSSDSSGAGPQKITLYAVGDVMLGRHIGKVIAERGPDYPFSEISPALHGADIVFGNLESILSSRDLPPSFPEKPYNFRASADAAQMLRKAGFHVLSLANNHAMDYGTAALLETKELLAEEKIAVCGAGVDIGDARRPGIIVRKGIRFGFLGYGIAHAPSVYAGRNSAGVAPVRIADILKDVQALRKRVDVLVVSLHWGTEYERVPGPKQQHDAHRIIDAGADLILGHHPHVMQGVEIYKGRVIAYSLGNFIFDQKGRGTDRSFLLSCTFLGRTLIAAEIIPLDRFRTYFPRTASGKTKEEMLEEVKQISAPVNAGTQKLFKAGIITVREQVLR